MRNIEKNRISEILSLHSEIYDLLKTSLEKAIRIGNLLIEQKASLNHGEFGKWTEANLPFTDRTARNYMNCYRNRKLLKTENVSDLAGAYRLMGKRSEICEDFQKRLSVVKTPEECMKIRDEILEAAQDAAERLLYTEAEIGRAEADVNRLRAEEKLLNPRKLPKFDIPDDWNVEKATANTNAHFQEIVKIKHRIGLNVIAVKSQFGKDSNETLRSFARDIEMPVKFLRQASRFAKKYPNLTGFPFDKLEEKLSPLGISFDEFIFGN